MIKKNIKHTKTNCSLGRFHCHFNLSIFLFFNPSGVLYQNSHAHTFTNTYITPTPIFMHMPGRCLLRSLHCICDVIWQGLAAGTWGACRHWRDLCNGILTDCGTPACPRTVVAMRSPYKEWCTGAPAHTYARRGDDCDSFCGNTRGEQGQLCFGALGINVISSGHLSV